MLRSSSVCFLVVLVCVATAVSPGGTCGLKNYDISTLHFGQPYWFFDVKDSKNCIEESAKGCSVFFTVCQTLPDKYCGNTNSGICEVVTLADGTGPETYYSLGQATTMFDEAKEKDGFLAVFGSGSNATDKCPSKKLTTLISFQCDPKAKWDFTTGNVTEHVTIISSDPYDTCQLLVNIKYSGACIKEKPSIEGCSALKHYDLSALQSGDTWIANVPKESCKNPFNRHLSTDGTCSLLFSFCQPFSNEICGGDSIFCQEDAFGKGISFGSYNEEFEIDSDIDYTGFTISAYDDTKSRNCTDGFFSTLRFNCSTAANWSVVPNNDITKYVTAYPSVDECEFIVNLQYDGACTSYRPPKPKPKPKNWTCIILFVTAFAIGILIGILLGILIMYCIIGAVVQLVRGRRGADVIPNRKIWTKLFKQIQGCGFIFHVITCYRWQSGAQNKSKAGADKRRYKYKPVLISAQTNGKPTEISKDDQHSDLHITIENQQLI